MIPWIMRHHHHNHARSFNSLLQMIPRIMRGISAQIFPLQKAFMRAMKMLVHANTVKNHLTMRKTFEFHRNEVRKEPTNNNWMPMLMLMLMLVVVVGMLVVVVIMTECLWGDYEASASA